MTKIQKGYYYPDIPLFLIAIPFISAFNYYLTYTNIQFDDFLLLRYTIDTLQGYAAWWGVRAMIIWLDKKYPYEKDFKYRIAIQTVVVLLVGLSIIAITTEILSLLVKGKPAPITFYTVDLFIIAIWFLVIDGVYIGIYYYRLSQSLVNQSQTSPNNTKQFIVRHGKQDIKLNLDEIAGFYVDDDYAVACNVEGKRFYLDDSLDKIERQLPPQSFFRLNRQYIVNRALVSGFRRIENGKIAVILTKHEILPQDIIVSRLKAPSFKNWFNPT